MANILIVDDERAARFGMKKALARDNYEIAEAENGLHALEIIAKKRIDVVILDLNMPELNGIEVLDRIQLMKSKPLVIVVTAYGSEKIAVEAMKKGAYDYIAKPYEVEELRLTTQHALEKLLLIRENQRLQEEIRLRECFGDIIGESKAMLKIYDLIEKIAKTDVTVLIFGESGTGKELVAREIHKKSERAKEPFITMNCAALPENLIESELFGHEKGAFTGAGEQRKGKLEEAHLGTLFLDEIGDMHGNTQAKVLRVLQDRTFERLGGNKSIQADVRFIAATNKDLLQEIEDGKFREDLYYRIKVIDVFLPPLRDRGQDILLLANRFLDLFARKYQKEVTKIDPSAMHKIMNYHWPGNVRQLKNVIEKSVLLSMGPSLSLEDLSPEVLQENPTKEIARFVPLGDLSELPFKEAKRNYVREFERQFIIQRLQANRGNISKTANSLEIPRQSLQQKLKELNINAKEVLEE